MIRFIKKFLGLSGSWGWAVRQLKKGEIVRTKSSTGVVRLKLDDEQQGRILWSFPSRTDPFGKRAEWVEAYIFVSDFDAVDWEVI